MGEVGRGGMGVVYEARDEALARRVALKLVTAGVVDDGHRRQRLLREGQALAKLSHPNVVPVYDVGTVDEDVFVAMEFVDGADLKRWLAGASRQHDEILDVLIQAGRGLEHAHSMGLVHRDFKPANVLVRHDGRALVADFGLARPSNRSDSTPGQPSPPRSPVDRLASPVTRPGAAAGTPAYMPPEQVAGADVDERADQFSFCVTAWEALLGARPVPGADGVEAPAARRSTPRRALAALRRGLQRDPQRRHPSMNALLEELRPSRAAVPRIIALGAVVMAGVAAWPLLAATPTPCDDPPASSVWPAARRDAIQAAFLASDRPDADELFVRVGPQLDRYVELWTAAWQRACRATHDERTQSERDLDLRMTCLQERLDAVVALTDVLAQADGDVVDRAMASTTALPRIDRCDDAAGLAHRGASLENPALRAKIRDLEARHRQAHALAEAGKLDAAVELDQEVAAELRSVRHAPLLADVLVELGRNFRLLRRPRSSEDVLVEAAAVAAETDDDERIARVWAETVWTFSMDPNRLDDMRRARSAALATIDRLEHPAALAAEVAHASFVAQLIAGDYKGGVELGFDVLERYEALPDATAGALVGVRANLGLALRDIGRGGEARELLERAVEQGREELGTRHPNTIKAIINLSVLAEDEGDLRRARALLELAIAARTAIHGPRHRSLANLIKNRGLVDLKDGHFERGLLGLSEAVAILETAGEGAESDLAVALFTRAEGFAKAGRGLEGLRDARRALGVLERKVPRDHPRLIQPLCLLGSLEMLDGQYDETERQGKRALAIAETLGPEHPAAAAPLGLLGQVARVRGRFDEQLALCRRSLALDAARYGADNPTNVGNVQCVGRGLRDTGDHEAALPYFERAYDMAQQRQMAQGILSAGLDLAEARVAGGERVAAAPVVEAVTAAIAELGDRAEPSQRERYDALIAR